MEVFYKSGNTQITDEINPVCRLGGLFLDLFLIGINPALSFDRAGFFSKVLLIFIEFGLCPIYAHESSFSPPAGIIIIMIIITGGNYNYNWKSDYNL